MALPTDTQIPASSHGQLSEPRRSSLDGLSASGSLHKVIPRTSDEHSLHNARTEDDFASAIYASAAHLVPVGRSSNQAQHATLHELPQSSELVYSQGSGANLMPHKQTILDQVTCSHENSVRRHDDNHYERVPEIPKRAGISRSTYFRAKRNLRSIGSVKSVTTGKQIGRPQKLDANAEKVSICLHM